jgi:8-oxo-dGTP diphosphatase
MIQWCELNEINHEVIKFIVLVTKYDGQLVVIRNKKRGGWEIPGGNREPEETLLSAATRELYEETGAVKFDLEAFGIYLWNGSYGMIFYAEVHQFTRLPDYEIEEIKFVDIYPEGMNFGNMFYFFFDKWTNYKSKDTKKHSIDLKGEIDSPWCINGY